MLDRRNRERRGNTRSRVLKGVKLVLGKSSIVDCVARNVTNSGGTSTFRTQSTCQKHST